MEMDFQKPAMKPTASSISPRSMTVSNYVLSGIFWLLVLMSWLFALLSPVRLCFRVFCANCPAMPDHKHLRCLQIQGRPLYLAKHSPITDFGPCTGADHSVPLITTTTTVLSWSFYIEKNYKHREGSTSRKVFGGCGSWGSSQRDFSIHTKSYQRPNL